MADETPALRRYALGAQRLRTVRIYVRTCVAEPDQTTAHGFSPVMSLRSLKKPRLRAELIPQFTGTLW